MSKRLLGLGSFFVVAVLAACGGGGSSPTPIPIVQPSKAPSYSVQIHWAPASTVGLASLIRRTSVRTMSTGTQTVVVQSGNGGSSSFDISDPARPGFLWRTVAAQVALSTGDLLTVCSFHGRQPSGVPAAALQQAFHAGIASWLTDVPGPVIFGIDAGPRVPDSADPLLGPGPVHHLNHVLNADDDHLWATPDFTVLDVQCLADDATAAGSDHALLLADLELPDSPH